MMMASVRNRVGGGLSKYAIHVFKSDNGSGVMDTVVVSEELSEETRLDTYTEEKKWKKERQKGDNKSKNLVNLFEEVNLYILV
jgi:hypothetical protein